MWSQLGRRARQARRIITASGWRGLLAWALRAAQNRFLPPVEVAEVRTSDLLSVDPRRVVDADPLPHALGEPLVLNWVMTPPARGSGGHTTAFRVIRHLEERGHRCRVVLYDVFGGDARFYGEQIRRLHPGLRAEVHDIDQGLADAHIHFATSWQTAYPVASGRGRGLPGYLVQDFEPWFYPRSAEAVFAEDTYRLGFRALTAGRWLADELASRYGMVTASFDFGVDAQRYRLAPAPGTRRDGVAFYAKAGAPRRASQLGMLALQVLARDHPGVPIHLYGEEPRPRPFRCTDHGIVSPDELNRIYNRCAAGLSLSLTNVSLVPHEMLAAGCIPVVNDAEHNRVVLDNPHVVYAEPAAFALADAIAALLDGDTGERARVAASSVTRASWADAGDAAEAAILEWLHPPTAG